MYFTRQVQYIEHYIRTYGAVLLQYDGQNALKLHFTVSPISHYHAKADRSETIHR